MVKENVQSRRVDASPPSLSSAVLTELSFGGGVGGVTNPGARGELEHMGEGHLLACRVRCWGAGGPSSSQAGQPPLGAGGSLYSGSVLPHLPDFQVQLGF